MKNERYFDFLMQYSSIILRSCIMYITSNVHKCFEKKKKNHEMDTSDLEQKTQLDMVIWKYKS